MKAIRKKGWTMSIPAGVTAGASTSVLITILGAIVVAVMITKEVLKETSIGYGCMMILLSASFTGSMLAWSKVKRRRAVVCMLSGTVYFLMLLCITALFFGGRYQAIGATLGVILAGSGTAVLLGLRQGKSINPVRRKNIR